MGHTWRLFQLTQGFRWRLVWAALLGLTASAAGIGRLALSGYALALVFQGNRLPRCSGQSLEWRCVFCCGLHWNISARPWQIAPLGKTQSP